MDDELGPWMITAHNAAHAEYLMRSRAEQRGVTLGPIEVSGGEGGVWQVSAEVTGPRESAQSARLGDDTSVLHLGIRASARAAAPAEPYEKRP
jgi:hypothetical protein